MKSDANKRDPNYIHMWFETGLKSGCGLIRYQCKYADTLKMDLTEPDKISLLAKCRQQVEIQIVFEIQIGLVQCEHSQKEYKI